MADHTYSPFRLLYRVCSSCDGGFSPHSPHIHTFPALPLNQHSSLVVSLAYLPRLPQFPAAVSCKIATSKIMSSQRSIQRSIGQSTNEDSHTPLEVIKHSPNSVEAFPFSPPLPSPLSPKLLTGLADRQNLASPLLAADQHVVAALERNFKELTMDSDPVVVRTSERAAGGGVLPPAVCSPAPFSRMHTGRERGGAKRRSCAISCKVSDESVAGHVLTGVITSL